MVGNEQAAYISVDSADGPAGVKGRVLGAVRRNAMLAEGDVVVLAVSGGADSVAMLDVLVSERGKTLPAFEARVAHLHHGVRGDEADPGG